MRDYMLYKQAAGFDRKALHQAAGIAGGGALGYLLTRYGLGLKGAGAGIVGTGAGALAGSIGAGQLSGYGKEGESVDTEREYLKAKNKAEAGKSFRQNLRESYSDPMVTGSGAAVGLPGVLSNRGIKEGVESVAQKAFNDFSNIKSPAEKAAAVKKWSGKLSDAAYTQLHTMMQRQGARALPDEAFDALYDVSASRTSNKVLEGKLKGLRGLKHAGLGLATLPFLYSVYKHKFEKPIQKNWLKSEETK